MEKEDSSKISCQTYVATGAVNIGNIEHVENLFPGNPEMIASVLGGKKVAKKELTDDDLRNKIDALFLHLGLLGEVQKDMFPKDGSASVAKHNADYPTSCEVLDPTLQSYFLRKEKFAEIAKVLNETIKPNVEATGNKANWDYVCYAFKVLGIVRKNLSRMKVASLLVAMCPGIGEASTLESSMEKSSASYQGKYDYEKLKETEQLKIHSKPYIEALQPVV